MSLDPSAILYGLASAASWGAADFSGGFAAKRSGLLGVVIASQLVGVACLLLVVVLMSEPLPMRRDALIGGIAGIFGGLSLLALYRGLATSRMGVVAPVSALVAVIVPVIVGTLKNGVPARLQLSGFVVALIAIWLVSCDNAPTKIRWRDLTLPTAAGMGFGLFLTCIDHLSEGAVLWPLVAARVTSIGMLLLAVSLARQRTIPATRELTPIAFAGIFDTGGNALFAMATQAGRLDIAAALASLYPGATVILAWLVLKERLLGQQWIGVVAALVAVALMAS